MTLGAIIATGYIARSIDYDNTLLKVICIKNEVSFISKITRIPKWSKTRSFCNYFERLLLNQEFQWYLFVTRKLNCLKS